MALGRLAFELSLWLPQLLLPLLLVVLLPGSRVDGEKICPSMEIRALEDFEQLRHCTVIVGHVSIVNLQIPPDVGDRYSSSLVEITDYLLVYRAEGLRSLGQLFPHLVIVRGQELLHDRYVLVVFENRLLQDLGLVSLLRLQQGSVRIEDNPELCFVDTVNWVYLLNNSTEQHFFLKNNKSPNFCPVCLSSPQDDDAKNTKIFLTRHCWNLESVQTPPFRGRSSDCISECDPKECVGCRICPKYRQARNCVEACIVPNIMLNKRECVRDRECRELGRIPHGTDCLESCPPHYEKSYNGSMAFCSLLCSGDYVIRTADDLAPLADCTSIRGSLTIQLKPIRTKIIEEMEQSLKNIKEITGFLKVIRSPQLVSLNFLPKLDSILGTDGLIDNKYALYVVDNHHLEEIWAPNQKVAVLKGRVYFHLNPRLCIEKILLLAPSLKDEPRIGIEDASPNSNGERVICGDHVRELNATVEDFNSTAALIKVNPMTAEEKVTLLGYLYHYKEAPVKNVTMYDGRHGCGHDNWRMDISASQNVRHIITDLKPFTQYAYFVKTLMMTEYHNQHDAYSKIQYFWTMPSQPGPVAKIYASASSTKIVVHWWPPKQRNGQIEKYIVRYEDVPQNSTISNYSIQTKLMIPRELSCQCAIVMPEPEQSGPVPDDDKYYNREQLIYDEALPDLIYVPRSLDVSKARKPTPTKEDDDDDDDNQITTTIATTEVPTTTTSPVESRSKRKSNDDRQTPSNQIEKSSKDKLSGKDANDDDGKAEKHNVSDGESIIDNFRRDLEMKALLEQDTGRAAFAILKPTPICVADDASVQVQVENGCRRRQRYEGAVVPGFQHTFTVRGLQPKAMYRISVRACVAGLENGCGSETSLLAETLDERIEKFLQGIPNPR